jgi:competence protein ComEC
MSEAQLPPSCGALGAWWRAALVLAWVGGVGLQLQQPALWPREAYLLLAAGALGLVPAWRRRLARVRARRGAGVLALVCAGALGLGYAGWRADLRLSDALGPEWEGCDLELVGVVDEMPQVAEDGLHFAFAVESARVLPMATRELGRVTRMDAAAGAPITPAVAAAIATAVARASGSESDAGGEAPGPGEPPAGADVVDVVDVAAGAAPAVPTRVWLTWAGNPRDDRATAAAPAPLRAGQRWRLGVRLRRPHGALNPDGFDAELWLFDQGLRATGAVRGNGALLSEGWAPIGRTRQWVRDRLLLAGSGPGVAAAATGTLAALAVGDQSAIAAADWETFRDTGVAHLVAISGLHITMLGWLGAAGCGWLWRRSERATLWIAAPVVARWGGVGVAWFYALLAGWGVPAQRTVLMLAAGAVLRGGGRNWPPVLVALAAMLPVTLLDPWALLQPGFWLSFAAVALLMVAEPARAPRGEVDPRRAVAGAGAHARATAPSAPGPPGRTRAAFAAAARLRHALAAHLRGGLRTQVIASVGLAPLTLVAFQQVSLVGLLANLVAEPWITLVVTPLTLAGVALPGLWQLAALALSPLLWLLAALGRASFASVHVAAAPSWALVAGLAGGAVLMLALPWRARLVGLPLLLPLAAPFVARPEPGRFELVAADVGQGSAILVRTHGHLLLFDTGPAFGPDSDAGRRMLLPLLQGRGEPRIDTLVLSHADADHVGGAQSLMSRLPVRQLRSSLEPRNPLRVNALPHVACEAGQVWDWDHVRFTILHPPASDYRPGAKTNAISCVLRVVDASGRSALLTGDIEAAQEAALVARDRAALRSDVLIVPHHGSRTSSTEAFVAAVAPRVAVIQVGYRSRYGHPVPDVVARYRAHGIAVVRTDHCGAWSWAADVARCTRAVRRRYWNWQGKLETPVPERIGAASASAVRPGSAGSDVANDHS